MDIEALRSILDKERLIPALLETPIQILEM